MDATGQREKATFPCFCGKVRPNILPTYTNLYISKSKKKTINRSHNLSNLPGQKLLVRITKKFLYLFLLSQLVLGIAQYFSKSLGFWSHLFCDWGAAGQLRLPLRMISAPLCSEELRLLMTGAETRLRLTFAEDGR